jgi:hypothetical protein
MKNFKKLFTISFLPTILTVLMIMQGWNVSTTAEVTLPYKMDYKTFQLEVLQGQSAIVNYQGTIYLNLTLTNEHPMGTLYDSVRKVVYMAIYPGGANPDLVWGIAEINITDYSYKIYRFPWLIEYYGYDQEHPEWGPQMYCGPSPWTIAEDGNGELWISIRSYLVTPNHSPEYRPYLAKLNVTSNTLTIYYIPAGSGNDIKFHNGYIWYLTNPFLKINATSEEIVSTYPCPFYLDGFMDSDGDYIWITSCSDGIVTRFNTVTGTFDLNLTGFDRPLGLYADSECVYVAENSQNVGTMGTIAKINKTSLQITRLNTANITNEGPYHVLKDSYGYLWFTDNSNHLGIVGGIVYDSISPYCYFMTEVPGSSIWFSAVGSAYIGMKNIGTLGNTDINKDGVVDIRDISAVGRCFGKTVPPAPSELDFNGDEIIDIRDISTVARNYGKTL